ncbi:MAG: polyprenol monophosphomannose synthase [Balneolales bacterium]|nr:polyprenol monophosphomannose synthase [Balneolales bacterium]
MQSDSDILVIVPTYNEIENVEHLIPVVMNLEPLMHILFVDDNSPDDTAGRIRHFASVWPGRIHLLSRNGKQGLGSAYVAGFKYAIEQHYEYICEMDADFSHSPEDLPKLVYTVKSGVADVAIGSRYHNGISIINWPLSRLILSYTANLYARWITGLPVKDTTAGFKCFRREVLEKISLDRIKSNGYAFQIEMHYRAFIAGFKLKEVSIIFRERKRGESKISKAIIFEAVWMVWALKLRKWFRRL